MTVPCKHWTGCGVLKGGCCAKGLYGGMPSYGVCLQACTEYDGPARGRGDQLKRLLHVLQKLPIIGKAVEGCGGCGSRQLKMNKKFPLNLPKP